MNKIEKTEKKQNKKVEKIEKINNNKNEDKKKYCQREIFYEITEIISKKIKDKPIISILISAAIGSILGFLISKKNNK